MTMILRLQKYLFLWPPGSRTVFTMEFLTAVNTEETAVTGSGRRRCL